MTSFRYELWETAPAQGDYAPYLLHYRPQICRGDGAILLVPGSGYRSCPALPKQEGERVAEYLCKQGLHVFLLVYRVFSDGGYPYPLLDGRRAMRLLRHRAKDFCINPARIVTLGYSAGGHLCASLVSYHASLEGECVDDIDKQDYIANFQALCYPVISFDVSKAYTHSGSVYALLGEDSMHLAPALSFEQSLPAQAPPTFLFHNFDDTSVGVQNTLLYACRLRELGTPVEMHIYPDGGHGVGFAVDDQPSSRHNRDWLFRFVNWLQYNGLWDPERV